MLGGVPGLLRITQSHMGFDYSRWQFVASAVGLLVFFSIIASVSEPLVHNTHTTSLIDSHVAGNGTFGRNDKQRQEIYR